MGHISINCSIAMLNSIGEDTLICSLGDYRKYIPVRVNSINNDLSLLDNTCYGTGSNVYTLTLKSDPEVASVLIGQDTYEECDYAVFSAFPYNCYRFVNWTDEETGLVISNSAIDSVMLDRDRTLIAHFERDSFDVVINRSFDGEIIHSDTSRVMCGSYRNTTVGATIDCFSFVH